MQENKNLFRGICTENGITTAGSMEMWICNQFTAPSTRRCGAKTGEAAGLLCGGLKCPL